LADLIRPLLSWRAAAAGTATPPKGSTGDGGFTIIPEMMSILGCSSEELGEVLKALGFRVERKLAPKQVAAVPAAEPVTETTAPATADASADGELTEEAGDESAMSPDAEAGPVATDVASAREIPVDVVAKADETATVDATAAPETRQPEQTSAPAADAEMTYIEIWRPRRRQRSDRHGQRTPPADAQSEGAPRHGQGHHHGKKDRHQRPQGGRPHQDRRDRRNKEEQRRRPDDRPRQEFRSAPKKAVVDPDSPFAALSALRSELEKRAKEQGTT
jgi:ATP-dependent RNA helicase SUPV3L1/SUV3